jgi:hypothetical protein
LTYGEFFLYYMLLPWLFALICFGAAAFIVILGGSELRTILGGKMNPHAHFVLGWFDGGRTELRTYVPFEPNIMTRKNVTEFLTYSTALSKAEYGANMVSFDQARRSVPPEIDDATVQAMVQQENLKRVAEAQRKNLELPQLNEAASTKTSFCGRPLWVGHLGVGAALQPELLRKLEGNERLAKRVDRATQSEIDLISPDTIKDFFLGNFNSGILYSILRRGIDYGKYGKPKQGFPMILLLVLGLAAVLLIVGFLILSGKLDVSGFVKSLGLGI